MIPLSERLKQPKPLLYDGGFGSQLFARGIELPNSSVANELHPEEVVSIHRAYIEAGADAIGTNTFVGSTLHLKMAGKDPAGCDRLARAAVEHARAAVERSGKETYIAGSLGPSPGAIEADSGDTSFGIANHLVRDAHRRLADALAELSRNYPLLLVEIREKRRRRFLKNRSDLERADRYLEAAQVP